MSRRTKEHSAHLSTILFIFGFVFDIAILPDIDDPQAKIVGLSYLVGIGLLIIIREWIVERNRATQLEQRLYSLSTFAIVCFLGSTLSFVSIYSFRSADITVSWPFFLCILGCVLANELVSTHRLRLTLDVGILFVSAVFYFIFHLPVVLGKSNDAIFALSIGITVVVALGFSVVMRYVSETGEHEAARMHALAIGIPMFVGMMYYLNILPAVPLSLKERGVYYHIEREDGGRYRGTYELDDRFLHSYRASTITVDPHDPAVYFFSAVDAPSALTAPLSHVWEYYDEQSHSWQEKLTVPFSIEGGRENGYRAYSVKENMIEGLWRITVKVDTNRVVGRERFYVRFGTPPQGLREKEL